MLKKTIKKIRFFFIITSVFILITSCVTSNETKNMGGTYNVKTTESRKQSTVKNDEDLILTFNFSKINKFQPIHLDLINGFGILAKMELENGSILKKMHVRLREISSNEKYSLGKVEYLQSIIIDSVTQKKVHNLTIELVQNMGERKKQVIAKLPNTNIIFKENEIIDIHIDAEALGIQKTELIFENNILTKIKKDSTHFGDQQCMSRIINVSN